MVTLSSIQMVEDSADLEGSRYEGWRSGLSCNALHSLQLSAAVPYSCI